MSIPPSDPPQTPPVSGQPQERQQQVVWGGRTIEVAALGGAILGGVIGYAVTGNRRGAVIGAVIGAYIMHRNLDERHAQTPSAQPTAQPLPLANTSSIGTNFSSTNSIGTTT
ncbi:MAG: hypothetical protein LBE98_04395 [Puniceicoccales bacterium]|jgi:uncharacterized membrane protein|nr:hypothetical protein [Puniceicoccales bacterium]